MTVAAAMPSGSAATMGDILSRVARAVGVDPSPGFSGSSLRLAHQELRDDYLMQAIDDIYDRVDLPDPIGRQQVITGTGDAQYALNDDFRRLMKDKLGVYETTKLRRAGVPMSSQGAWTHLLSIGTAGTDRYFRINGYEGEYYIEFEQELASGDSVTVSYMSNRRFVGGDPVAYASGIVPDDFVTSSPLLPRRLLELGTELVWRRTKGQDPMKVSPQFERELHRLEINNGNIRAIYAGDGYNDVKPMRVPVPDFIPSS